MSPAPAWWRKLRAPKPLESDIERSFCRGLPFPCVKLGGMGERGKSDRMVLCRFGHAIFIEFKRPGEEPDPLQDVWRTRLEALGYECHTISTKEGAGLLKRRILSLTPEPKGRKRKT